MENILIIIVSIIMLAYLLYSYISRYMLRQKNEELKYRLDLLKNSIASEESMTRARHRISHEESKISAVKKRLLQKYGNRLVLERTVLEEILQYEKEKAEFLDIVFTSDVGYGVEEILLKFGENERIAFFVNLIDNAVEAAALASEGCRRVSISVGKAIRMENSCAIADINKIIDGQSTKDDKEHHGFGLGIIKQYCDEKGLNIDYSIQNDILITNIQIVDKASMKDI